MLQLVTGFTGFGAGGVVRTALPPEVVAGTAKLFCNSLPRHLARTQQLTPAWLGLLETQLSVLCWRGELGLTAQQVARALATMLPAAQRGLTSLAVSEPGATDGWHGWHYGRYGRAMCRPQRTYAWHVR